MRAASWPYSVAHARFERAYLVQEKLWLPRFSRLLAASHENARRLNVLAPQTPVTVYPNALPLIPPVNEKVQDTADEETVIGFSGNFGYHPNIAAVRFLLNEIWPLLAERLPSLKLRLIGRNPQAISHYVHRSTGIEVTGVVEDAISELAKLSVAIVPLLSGSGTRIKILEAWAAARPVVSTSIGAAGIGVRPGTDIVLADTPETFAASVFELLGSKERRRQLGCAGRRRYEEGFTWEVAWRSLAGEVFL
jgi:glycosyltransferase involved in cell wall biosynthesis